MFYAVTINLAQARSLETEVVVNASTAAEARVLAIQRFVEQVLDETSDAKFITDSVYHTEEPRIVEFDLSDPDQAAEVSRIPYVYDTYNNVEINTGYSFGIEPDLDSLDGPDFSPSWDDSSAAISAAPVVTTSVGTPVPFSDSFETRPTKGLPRPLVTLENGYTPIDGEFREHPVRPYYLGGPAQIRINGHTYGPSQPVTKAPAAHSRSSSVTWDTSWDD